MHELIVQLRRWLDRVEDRVAATSGRTVPTETLASSAVARRDAARSCERGHARVTYSAARCPVCALKQRAGYSEKWCDTCGATTAHVGGLHVFAVCLTCLARRQMSATRTAASGVAPF
jgi:hypothetical protein